jgi:hypothetical protein
MLVVDRPRGQQAVLAFVTGCAECRAKEAAGRSREEHDKLRPRPRLGMDGGKARR